MITRPAVMLLGLLAAACAGSTPDAADPAAADREAIAGIQRDYVTHFNLHHAGMVADLMVDSASFFGANGAVDLGREMVVAGLEEVMAASPTLAINPQETLVLGDRAFVRGSYSIEMTPPGAAGATHLEGYYLTAFERHDAGWKIGLILTNYDTIPPPGLPRDSVTVPVPTDDGTMTDLVSAFTTHYNMGHAPQVAALYTDSAVAMLSDGPALNGRAAIEARLAADMAAAPSQLTVHDVETMSLPDGWAFDGGWYDLAITTPGGPARRTGVYVLLARRQDDGSFKIHWFISNGGPAPMQ